MNPFFIFDEAASEASSNDSSTQKLTESLMQIVKSPVFYIVIGAIVLLILAVYLFRRIVSPRQNAVIIIAKKGQIVKLLDEKSPKHFLVPFVERVGAIIPLGDMELTSDKLFINNGPDALYKVNFTLKFKVVDPKEFYRYQSNIEGLIVARLNEDLREFADRGNAMILVRDYRDHASEILTLINKAIEQYSVSASQFKINLIEPLGKK